ncbi:hypothetical protein ILUMI_12191 [Ignelater luminosus]|uniref:C2H2-type domain-containing protein n=1 Tax=Ignelater luminosus TaxID=2038154 RepID=A0A8K0GD72_IGNLU|nr:hypothetical protein ILUMI_12191 [Ignelater luminosus]
MGDTHIGLDAIIPDSDLISIKDKLSSCVPEMDLNIVSEAVMCELCVAALHTTFSFKTKCQETEEYLQNCIRNQRNTSAIDLSQITISVNQSNDLNNEFEHISSQEVEVPAKINERIKTFGIHIKQEPIDKDTCENEETYDVIDENTDETYNDEDVHREYKCLICNKTYKREIGLTAHMRMHETERHLPQKASATEISSYNMNEIREFLPKQTDTADSVCEICQKRFYRQFAHKQSLIGHLQVHSKNNVENLQTTIIKSEPVEVYTNEITKQNNEKSWLLHSNSLIENGSLLKRSNSSLNNGQNRTYENIIKTESYTNEVESCSFIKMEQNEVDCVETAC